MYTVWLYDGSICDETTIRMPFKAKTEDDIICLLRFAVSVGCTVVIEASGV